MDQYPTLNFMMRHGQRLAIALGFVPVIATLSFGTGFLGFVVGCVVGAVVYGLVRSYIELIQLVTDMLMPK
jgi:hypothetical protein